MLPHRRYGPCEGPPPRCNLQTWVRQDEAEAEGGCGACAARGTSLGAAPAGRKDPTQSRKATAQGRFRSPGGVPSLIGGLFVGFLAGYGAYRVSNDKRDVKLSLFAAFFLATIMGVRFKRSKKIMPAGLVAGLSLMMILRLVLLLL
ncbi:transmembrane protein 14A isoform X2 [Tupaia chinensis]|uniref:transmembrane protein 14A isoform X2 n=1 Tax=Tupaia chinensis TaxID=246437 RepID=UPI000FFB2675|nr:transmembrane protein 14A isoform X2 [Tupaia chinensis]